MIAAVLRISAATAILFVGGALANRLLAFWPAAAVGGVLAFVVGGLCIRSLGTRG
jgi:hypothetical protein